jgi:hypothetical protein
MRLCANRFTVEQGARLNQIHSSSSITVFARHFCQDNFSEIRAVPNEVIADLEIENEREHQS